MSDIIIGIDPGKKGGIAVYQDNKWEVHMMPLSGKDINEKALDEIFFDIYGRMSGNDQKTAMAYLEKVHAMPGQGVTSMFTFGMGYGILRGILTANWIPYQLVTPQAWKKVVLAGLSKEKTESCNYVLRKYPEIELMPGRKRVPDLGIADAVCIAEYGILTNK